MWHVKVRRNMLSRPFSRTSWLLICRRLTPMTPSRGSGALIEDGEDELEAGERVSTCQCPRGMVRLVSGPLGAGGSSWERPSDHYAVAYVQFIVLKKASESNGMRADVGVGVGGKWVLCGCNKHGVGAARAVWAVEGCGVSSTDEHPPAPACLPAYLPLCLSVSQHVWSGPTDRDTVHHDYHCTVVPVRTQDSRDQDPRGTTAIHHHQLLSRSAVELPWLKQRTEATDPQDSGLLPRSSSCCRRLNNVHQSHPVFLSKLTTSAQHGGY